MPTGPDVAELRTAYREAAARDLDRAHDEIVADAARSLGVDVEVAVEALPRLGSAAWQREFSVSSGAPPIPDDLTVAEALEILRSDAAPAARAQAVSDALAYSADGDTADLVVEALADAAAVVRRTAIRRSWLASGKVSAVRERIGELVASDPDTSVRAAAIRATALSGDDSPATVTALLATVSPANDSALRTAAANALIGSGRGYARVCRVLLRWAREASDDVLVQNALYDAAARLATEDEWPYLADQLLLAASRDMRVGLYLKDTLRELPETRHAVRDASTPLLTSADPATRRGAVHLVWGTTDAGGEGADLEAWTAMAALVNDPDESVRDAVYIATRARTKRKESGR